MKNSQVFEMKIGPDAKSPGKPVTWLRKYLRDRTAREGCQVPCGNCNACCRNGYRIPIFPKMGDVASRYKTEKYDGKTVLQLQEDGKTCVHLVGGKCEVYAHRPVECKGFDCRVMMWAGFSDPSTPVGQSIPLNWYPYNDGWTKEDRIVAIAIRLAALELFPKTKTAEMTSTAAVFAVELDPKYKMIAAQLDKEMGKLSPEQITGLVDAGRQIIAKQHGK